MTTKLAAARVALAAGCRMVIAARRGAASAGAPRGGGTLHLVPAGASPQAARKRWIAGTLKPAGTLVVDDGAVAALGRGKSLLPAGVIGVEGDFGEAARWWSATRDGRILGRGLVAYSSADARRIIGHKTSEIEACLGYRGRDEMIHRDDLALERRELRNDNADRRRRRCRHCRGVDGLSQLMHHIGTSARAAAQALAEAAADAKNAALRQAAANIRARHARHPRRQRPRRRSRPAEGAGRGAARPAGDDRRPRRGDGARP